jgi:predicted ABC-type ATPase
MLNRINEFLENGISFSFETTLSTRSYRNFVLKSQEKGYTVSLLFFWLESVDLAKERVRTRVLEGGHNIPSEVIERRYIKGIKNLFEIYMPIVDHTMIFDNTFGEIELIAEGIKTKEVKIHNFSKFELIKGK